MATRKSETQRTKIADLPAFDITEYLDNDVALAEYLTQVMADGDHDELVEALGIAAKAKGMTQMAESSGLTRMALYKALRSGAHPRFDTVSRVVTSLGLKLAVSV